MCGGLLQTYLMVLIRFVSRRPLLASAAILRRCVVLGGLVLAFAVADCGHADGEGEKSGKSLENGWQIHFEVIFGGFKRVCC